MDIEKVMVRLKAGEVMALEELYKDLAKFLLGYVFTIIKDENASQSIVHDVFIVIFEKAALYQTGTNPKAWVYSVARNLSIDYLRKKQKIIPFTDLELIEDNRSCYDNIVVTSLLEDLNDIEREITTLHIYAGLKHREIASVLGIPEATVRWHYQKALRFLKERAGDEDGTSKKIHP